MIRHKHAKTLRFHQFCKDLGLSNTNVRKKIRHRHGGGIPPTSNLLQEVAGNIRMNSGFTLIEVIVTLGVFTIAALMAVNLFVIFVQQQRRTVNQQELQNDARSVIEQVANDLREGVLDYEYYKTTFQATSDKLFSMLSGTGDECLVVRDALNMQIRYRLKAGAIERIEFTNASDQLLPCTSGFLPTDWPSITPNVLSVNNFTYFASPSEDPFNAQTPQSCTADPDCRWGTICYEPGSSTVYQFTKGTPPVHYCTPQKFSYSGTNDGFPLHPRVTFSLNVSRQVGQQTISQTFQTTVASRIFRNIDRLNQYAP